ncbi:hypothetical protein WN944_005791 [Citrus x changshan-huyou]|uniref:Uncharacterized protein n=1 Tax=Citrus x changshan-huyou TaxID=2935761 RepID=A0AAP0MI01_9ROSI
MGWRSVVIAIFCLARIRRILDLKSFRTIADLIENDESEANDPKLLGKARVVCVALKAVLHFTENLDLYPIEDAPPNAYSVAVPVTEDRRFHEPADVGGSTVNGHICELFGKDGKRALAVFYVVLETASFLLDIFGKSKRDVLLAAFLLSAFGFAVIMGTNTWTLRRTRTGTGMDSQKKLHMVLEISFSLVQLIVTLIYFILAELGIKNRFNTPVFPLVFAIVAAVFTFNYDVEVSDSSGHPSMHTAPAVDSQVHMPNNTSNEDAETNGSMPMLVMVTSHD